jgi:hypothetical protein
MNINFINIWPFDCIINDRVGVYSGIFNKGFGSKDPEKVRSKSMLESLVVGLTVTFWIAGIVSLILAKQILKRFVTKVEQGNIPSPVLEEAELSAQPQHSTSLPGFAVVPIQRLSFSKAGASRKFEALTHRY